MGDIRGFLKVKRLTAAYRPVCERVKDYDEVSSIPNEKHSKDQGSRCMDCGTPFCGWACPLGNYIPEWNDLLFRGKWEKAARHLCATNNLPEITGRICPSLCEYSCVLGINDDPVTIRENELAIIENAFANGLIKPNEPETRTEKRVAVIGSGPAGITCADELNKSGHNVVVFEKDLRAGGILRYGIPDFKLEKKIIDRRLDILKKEGVKFELGVNAGVDIESKKLLKDFDAIVLAGGSRVPRDLTIEGRELSGIYFAMDYLILSNRIVSGEIKPDSKSINARGKKVLVIGGGDTGADCVGTANRQGASCVIQIEIMPKPADSRQSDKFPWPSYPVILKTTTSHEEISPKGERHWSILAKKIVGSGGLVKKVLCAKLDNGMKEIPGSEFEIEADLVILAMGFVHPERKGIISDLGLALDERGNVKTGGDYMTSSKRVFACGDMRRGQSLVVWAIAEGRACAASVSGILSSNRRG